VEDDVMHDLVAGYAVDALDDDERRAFEGHLATCERCRDELQALSAPVLALSLGAPSVVPPPALRARVLAVARSERENVTPLRPRWAYPVAAAAAVATLAAVGLGVWAWTLHARVGATEALRGLALTGAKGSVVVSHGGAATLVISGLTPPPAGKTYELWVIRGRSAAPAGLFSTPGRATAIVPIRRAVPPGARVGITVEPAAGSARPSSAPIVLSAPA
jgi:anti-sigma-K factor RskA